MNIITDMSEVTELAAKLNKLPLDVNKSVLSASLKKSLKPTFDRAKQEVPVGFSGSFSRLGQGKYSRRKDYDRGGATKRDLRIAIKDDRENLSELIGLVGVKGSKNSVGWRTHFITRPTKFKKTANDFLKRASVGTIQEVESTLAKDISKVVQSRLKRQNKKIKI